MRRWARGLGLGLAFLSGALLLAVLITARPGDPALWPPRPDTETVTAYVVSNGYHTGLALPRMRLAEAAVTHRHEALSAVSRRFASYAWLEFGWGDRAFYQSVPTVGDLSVPLALRALFWPGNAAVLHVVGIGSDPVRMFPSADLVAVPLSRRGFEVLAARLDRAFIAPSAAGELPALGPGLYGPSLFYPAHGTFSILKVCNHWIADLLDSAGLPTTPVLDTIPPGLVLDLRWRAGLHQINNQKL